MSGYGQDAVDYLQDTQGQRQDRRQAVAGDLHDAAEKGMDMHQAAKGARQETAQEYDSSGGRRRRRSHKSHKSRSHKSRKSHKSRSHKSRKSHKSRLHKGGRKSRKSHKSRLHKGGRKSRFRNKSAGKKKCPKHCRRRSTHKHRRSRKHH